MSALIQRHYETGDYVGFKLDEVGAERVVASLEIPNSEEVAYRYDFASESAGKLVVPFVHVLEMYPDCWPGPGQGRGDCESHSVRNAGLGTHVMDIVTGEADEVTGKIEAPVQVGDVGRKNGVFSTEAIYLHAGHSNAKYTSGRNKGKFRDDGWYVEAAMDVMINKTGLVIRDNYPEIGIDFTKYDPLVAGALNGAKPDANFLKVTGNNRFRTATKTSGEADRDMLGRGYFIGTDGGESFSNVRDEHGFASRTSRGWSHAMAKIGYDDRPWAHRKYGGPASLILNSWRFWNKGPRDIYDSAQYVPADKKELWIKRGIVNPETGNIMIPRGSFWARDKDVRNRRGMAISGLNGWGRPKLPDYLGGW